MSIYSHIDFLQLKNRIAAALNDLLGDYLFPADSTAIVKAIAIDLDGNYPPKGTVVDIRSNDEIDPLKNGLEVVIRPQQGHECLGLLNTGQLLKVSSEIILKQWNPYQNVLPALDVLLTDTLVGESIDVNPRVLRNESIGNIESQAITIVHDIAYRKPASV